MDLDGCIDLLTWNDWLVEDGESLESLERVLDYARGIVEGLRPVVVFSKTSTSLSEIKTELRSYTEHVFTMKEDVTKVVLLGVDTLNKCLYLAYWHRFGSSGVIYRLPLETLEFLVR